MRSAGPSTICTTPRLRFARATVPALWALLMALATAATSGMVAVTHAQITPWPVVLTMTGPATAVSGQEITYRVHYRLTDPATISQAAFRIVTPENTTYVSTQVVSGPAGLLAAQEERFVLWGGLGNTQETEGDVELTVKVDADYVGLVYGECYIPGTETGNPESQCSLETEVSAPGAAPEEGDDGGSAAEAWLYAGLVVLGLVGAASIGVVAVRHRMKGAR